MRSFGFGWVQFKVFQDVSVVVESQFAIELNCLPDAGSVQLAIRWEQAWVGRHPPISTPEFTSRPTTSITILALEFQQSTNASLALI